MKDINIKILNNIDLKVPYKGTVKVIYVDKNNKEINRTYHNEGKTALFTSICRALCGYDIKKYVPKYIFAYSENDQPSLIQKVPYTATPTLYNTYEFNEEIIAEKSTVKCNTVEYVFIIPSPMIAIYPICKLVLLNDSLNICAEIDLSESPITQNNLIDSSNILIYWKLQFGNE